MRYLRNERRQRQDAVARSFFKASAMAGVGAVAATTFSAPASLAAGHSNIRDLTHTLHPDFPTYFGTSGFQTEDVFKFSENGFNLLQLSVNEHTGTHIDAPLHFTADGNSVDEIPVENLVTPLCVIDITARAQDDPDTRLTPEDIKAWIATNGEIPDNACVAMNSGWASKVNSAAFRGFDGEAMHYPGFHIDATNMLLEETGANSMAVDTLSLDHGISADFITHYAWLPAGKFGIENLANLDSVPAVGATLIVGAPTHRGGTGGPARIIALV